MNKTQCYKLLAGALLIGSTTASANEFSADVGIANNYVWRGVTQSDVGISVSGRFDYSNDLGLYAGTWLSSVDFNDDTNFEYDFYAGYQKTLSNVILDIGYIYYAYQGEDDLAFSEAYVKALLESFTLGVLTLVDSDAGGSFADSSYFEGGDNYQDYRVYLGHGDFSLMASTLNGDDALEDTLESLSYSTSFDL